MKILIVEDETTAYENLVELLAEIAPEAEILFFNKFQTTSKEKWRNTKFQEETPFE